jgi:hypothetical protein
LQPHAEREPAERGGDPGGRAGPPHLHPFRGLVAVTTLPFDRNLVVEVLHGALLSSDPIVGRSRFQRQWHE